MINNGNVIRHYSMPIMRKYFYLFIPLILYYCVSIFCLLGLASICLFAPETIGSNQNELRTFAIGLFFSIILMPIEINTFPDIKLLDDGLLVQKFMFWFKWKFIPWENICRIKRGKMPATGMKPIWILYSDKLGFFHRLISFRYNLEFQPGIVISNELSDCDELISFLKTKTDYPHKR